FVLFGVVIHYEGVENYVFCVDDWSVYALITGLAFIIRYFQTKKGLIPGAVLIGIALVMIFSVTLPDWFQWIYGVVDFLESFWPVAVIAFGVYLLKFKK